MHTYRYAWPKQDGTQGTRETCSAEDMLKFISNGDKDRTLYAETQGTFLYMDMSQGLWVRLTFAGVIRHFLEEIEAQRSIEDDVRSIKQSEQESA
ncbi:MAG: hypothetical protein IPL83_02450 [Bdellovibrionales bacterium]|nr:hypothetical protein [Bdellovibrionales bacterium]